MVKADLITGFLGAGKTTFIREYVKYLNNIGEKVCILENDYGAINVDMMLLSDLQSERLGLEMVAGGCDYDCHLRRFKTKLITMAMLGYDRVIVEPSGVFDVDEFFDVLHEDRLSSMYEIGNVLTIVDADMEEVSEEGQYMLGGMLACAGKIILSRVQEVDETCVHRTVEQLNDILSKVSCKRVLSDQDILVKDWSLLDENDFKVISSSSYKDIGYVKHFS
ncbi:MAG: GTPase (G3E family), partial [Erysipelotrichaceae bacterium]|nr:GTPase (G3E family) [Erysipelotrichaceae bacterium]